MSRLVIILIALFTFGCGCGNLDSDYEWSSDSEVEFNSHNMGEVENGYPFTMLDREEGEETRVQFEDKVCSPLTWLYGVDDRFRITIPHLIPQKDAYRLPHQLPLGDADAFMEHLFTSRISLESETSLDFIEAIEVVVDTNEGQEVVGYAYLDETCEGSDYGYICPGTNLINLETIRNIDIRTDSDSIQAYLNVKLTVPSHTVAIDLVIALVGLHSCEI